MVSVEIRADLNVGRVERLKLMFLFKQIYFVNAFQILNFIGDIE